MTILSDRDIHDRLGFSVIIDPFNPENVNTSSYDVTLGENYFIEHKPSLAARLLRRRQVYNIWHQRDVARVWGEPLLAEPAKFYMPQGFWTGFPLLDWRLHWKWAGIDPDDKVILIPPKHTILAHTQEFIGGRESPVFPGHRDLETPVTTMMKARSSFGRNFIEVCKCAGYGDVGYTNRWTMEITNNSRYYHIPLVVGRRIAQIVFMETGELRSEHDYSTTGKYQTTPDVEKLKAEWDPWQMLPRLDRDRDISNPEDPSPKLSRRYLSALPPECS